MRSLRLIAIAIPVVLVACTASAPETDTTVDLDAPLDTEVLTVTMPAGKTVEDPQHGTEAFLAVGAMNGNEEFPANGVATMHVFSDGFTIIGTQMNVGVPDDGTYYEAWLAKADGTPAISLGHLTNPFSDVRHQLRFEQKDDLRAYSTVVVTLEHDDGNPGASSTIVAKGTLKTQKRG